MDNRGYIALAIIFIVVALTLLRSSNIGLIDFYDDGTTIAQRSGLNLVSGDGILVSGADDPTNSRVNITVSTYAETGTATVTAGQTSVEVTHGLSTTPDRVLLTPTTDWQSTTWYVSAKTATTFTITLSSSIGSNVVFDWRASKEE